MNAIATPLLLVGTLILFAAAFLALSRRYPRNESPLVDAIDAALPQTQCAQCGFPGCRPYAEAVAAGAAALDLCPPGGEATHAELQRLMGASGGAPPEPTPIQLAVIDEAECIGCALCLPACPVDAIVGAPNFMHTVIDDECTGCELCVAPCPVDCIHMVEVPQPAPRREPPKPELPVPTRACIKCSRCDPVCPVDLPVMSLIQHVRQGHISTARDRGLSDCIECGLCDRACPSGINLAAEFSAHKRQLTLAAAEEASRRRFKQRYDAHAARHAAHAASAEAKRSARLKQKGSRTWT